MKTLNITFTDEEYKVLDEVKDKHEGNWHDFILDAIRRYKIKMELNGEELNSPDVHKKDKTNNKKWQFCPDKTCNYCGKKIEEVNEEIVTGCPHCKRSFLE